MSMQQKVETYLCEVREVFSGDDLIVLIDLGVDNLWKRQRVRLAGVDAPSAVNAAEGTEAGQVRRQVKQLVRYRRGEFTVQSKLANSWVGTLVVEATTGVVNLNEMLLAQGYVFKKAEK